MPSNVNLTEEEEARLEEGGGVSHDTKRRREKAYLDFHEYVLGSCGKSIAELLTDEDEGKQKLSKTFSMFFWSMRVEALDGSKRKPKRGYAEKLRSLVKMTVIDKHKVNLTDASLFPDDGKRWKSFCDELAKEGLGSTTHFEEVDAETMDLLYQVFGYSAAAVEARGTDQYEELLHRLPLNYQHRPHILLQKAAQCTLQLLEVRRGVENLSSLKKSDFVLVDDNTYKLKYWKKDLSEKDKNHDEGTNKDQVGVIPYIDFTPDFNPGKVFGTYMSVLPDKGTLEGKPGGFLMPKAKVAGKGVDLHNPDQLLFQPNQTVGKSYIADMLPSLCLDLGRPRVTNHQLRVTSIKYLRRAGVDWMNIAKVSGHKKLENLINSYDLTLEAPGLATIAAAIATGPGVAQGEVFAPPQLTPRRDLSQVCRPYLTAAASSAGAGPSVPSPAGARQRRSRYVRRRQADSSEDSETDSDVEVNTVHSEYSTRKEPGKRHKNDLPAEILEIIGQDDNRPELSWTDSEEEFVPVPPKKKIFTFKSTKILSKQRSEPVLPTPSEFNSVQSASTPTVSSKKTDSSTTKVIISPEQRSRMAEKRLDALRKKSAKGEKCKNPVNDPDLPSSYQVDSIPSTSTETDSTRSKVISPDQRSRMREQKLAALVKKSAAEEKRKKSYTTPSSVSSEMTGQITATPSKTTQPSCVSPTSNVNLQFNNLQSNQKTDMSFQAQINLQAQLLALQTRMFENQLKQQSAPSPISAESSMGVVHRMMGHLPPTHTTMQGGSPWIQPSHTTMQGGSPWNPYRDQSMVNNGEVFLPLQTRPFLQYNQLALGDSPAAPQQGHVLSGHRQVVPSPEQVLSGYGPGYRGHGLVLPGCNEVLNKAHGRVLPQTHGEVRPEFGKIHPEQRQVIPEQRQVLPEQRQVLPEQRQVLSEQRQIFPEQRRAIPVHRQRPELSLVNPEIGPQEGQERVAQPGLRSEASSQIGDTSLKLKLQKTSPGSWCFK